MRGKTRSFSTRISLNIMLIVGVFFIFAIIVAAIGANRLISEEATRSAANLLQANIAGMEKKLQSVEIEAKSLARDIVESSQTEEEIYRCTEALIRACPDVSGCAVAYKSNHFPGKHFFSPFSFREADGSVTSIQLGREDYDYFYMDWYQIPYLLGEPAWSEPYFDDGGSGRLLSTYSVPLKDENGEVYAVVTSDIPLDWLAMQVAEIRPYEHSHTMIASRNGSIISDRDSTGVRGETLFTFARQKSDPRVMEICKKMIDGESGNGIFKDGNNSGFIVYGPLANGWTVATVCDSGDVLARTSLMRRILTIIGIFSMALIFLLCYYSIRVMTRPLANFSESALSIAEGNFDTELPQINSHDEIGQLRNSFEFMQQSLVKYIEDLKVTTEQQGRMESELNIARQLQQNLLPVDFPHTDAVNIGALVQPAKEVGGDLYDYFIKDNLLYFMIGDVSGKGIPAAMFMAVTKSSFRFVCSLDLPIDEMVGKINDFVASGNQLGMFVTMFSGIYDMATGELRYCNAGHNPIIVHEPGKEPAYMKPKANLVIGLVENFPFEMETVHLAKGTHLLLYTDGVTEAETVAKNQYGEERLLSWVKGNLDILQDPEAATSALLADVKAFTGDNEQNDDITIMNIKLG